MTAGRGIVHSEMPQQIERRMRGFQLWLNLPAREKMCPAGYRDLAPEEMGVWATTAGGQVKVIAGRLALEDALVVGPVNHTAGSHATDPHYFDVHLQPEETVTLQLPAELNGFVYCYEHSVAVDGKQVPAHVAGVLGYGDELVARAGADGARLLLLAGRPLREPVAQYGPFVMNSRAELEQALADYRDGRLTEPSA